MRPCIWVVIRRGLCGCCHLMIPLVVPNTAQPDSTMLVLPTSIAQQQLA